MSDLEISLTAAVLVAVVLIATVGVFAGRRIVLARGGGTFDCSLRREGGHVAGRWMRGIARYESERLDWFRVFTVSPRPGRSLDRGRLVILGKRPAQGAELYAVIPGGVIVRCAYGASMLELAMTTQSYVAFATWLESAPPGQGANVA